MICENLCFDNTSTLFFCKSFFVGFFSNSIQHRNKVREWIWVKWSARVSTCQRLSTEWFSQCHDHALSTLPGYLLQPVSICTLCVCCSCDLCIDMCGVCVCIIYTLTHRHTRGAPFSLSFRFTQSYYPLGRCHPHSNANKSISLNWNQSVSHVHTMPHGAYVRNNSP